MRFLRNQGKSLLAAIAFLTRLPLGRIIAGFDKKDYQGSVAWFPVAGLLIGSIQAGIGWLAGFYFPAFPAAVLAFVAGVAASGGIHFDGLMDTADGVCSGKDPETSLEIMRDSHVGGFGVLAGILAASLQIAGLATWLASPARFPPVVISVLVVSRASISWAVTLFPYRRENGLGSVFSSAGKREMIGSALLTLALVWFLLSWKSIVLFAAGAVLTLGYSLRMMRRFGGLTGDMYGALAESTNALLLLLAAVFKL